jgi:hypothetical protein
MRPGGATGETGWHGMRKPGRGERCRPRSLGAWPRGTASASPVSSHSCWTSPNMRNPGFGWGRQRLVVASGCQEREIRPCSSPMTAPRDAAVPMFLQSALPAQWVLSWQPARITRRYVRGFASSGGHS